MSNPSVELVRRAWDVWLGGDLAALDDYFDPDIDRSRARAAAGLAP